MARLGALLGAFLAVLLGTRPAECALTAGDAFVGRYVTRTKLDTAGNAMSCGFTGVDQKWASVDTSPGAWVTVQVPQTTIQGSFVAPGLNVTSAPAWIDGSVIASAEWCGKVFDPLADGTIFIAEKVGAGGVRMCHPDNYTDVAANDVTSCDATTVTPYTNKMVAVPRTFAYSPSPFKPCDAGCSGTQTRVVACEDNVGNVADNSLCSGVAPVSSQACQTSICQGNAPSSLPSDVYVASVEQRSFEFQCTNDPHYYVANVTVTGHTLELQYASQKVFTSVGGSTSISVTGESRERIVVSENGAVLDLWSREANASSCMVVAATGTPSDASGGWTIVSGSTAASDYDNSCGFLSASTTPGCPGVLGVPTTRKMMLTRGPVDRTADLGGCVVASSNDACERAVINPRCENADGDSVSDKFCYNLPRPYEVAPVCSGCVEWRIGNWSDCPPACAPGFHQRTVECIATDTNTVTSDTQCELILGPKPPTNESCFDANCVKYVVVTSTGTDADGWGSCSVTCGSGVQKRSVQCITPLGVVKPNAECAAEGLLPPSLERNCTECGGVCIEDTGFTVSAQLAESRTPSDTTFWTGSADVCAAGSTLITRDQYKCLSPAAKTSLCSRVGTEAGTQVLPLVLLGGTPRSPPGWMKATSIPQSSLVQYAIDPTCTIGTNDQGITFVNPSRQSGVSMCLAN